MKAGFIEKILGRLDKLETDQVERLLAGLLDEKGFLESVFEALREGVIILDLEKNITFLNRSAATLFGLDFEKANGLPLAKLVPDLQVTEHASVSRDLEIRYPEHRFLNLHLSPIKPSSNESDGGILGHVMLVRDITQFRKETQQTLESERLNALTLLAAGVAHEIGNPLNSLNIHLQLLGREVSKLPPENQEKLDLHLDTARSEISRLDSILKDFLQAIRPTTPQRQASHLNKMIRQTLESLESELTDRKAAVRLDLEEPLPILQLDANQFPQALFNLIRNACQALSADGGEIRMSTIANDYEVITQISDNGSGIPHEVMGNLFEPYRTTKESGNGLGLLIVRRIINEHGGELEVESKEGEGTTVTIFLPRSEKRVRLLEDVVTRPIDIESHLS